MDVPTDISKDVNVHKGVSDDIISETQEDDNPVVGSEHAVLPCRQPVPSEQSDGFEDVYALPDAIEAEHVVIEEENLAVIE